MKAKTFRWALVLSALGWSAMADAQGIIKGINAHKSGDGAEIQILGEDLAMPKIIKSMGGRQYILEFDAGMTIDKDYFQLGYGTVKNVGISWHKHEPAKIWVLIRLEEASKPCLVPTPDGWLIQINTGEVLAASVHTTNPASGYRVSAPTSTPQAKASGAGESSIPVLPNATPILEPAIARPTTKVAPISESATLKQAPKVAPATDRAAQPATASTLFASVKPSPSYASAARTSVPVSIAQPIFDLHISHLAMMTPMFAANSAPQPIVQTQQTPATVVSKKHKKKKSSALPELAPLNGSSAVVAEAPASGSGYTHQAGTVSMDFTSTDVSTVVRAVAMQTRESIVVTPDVGGRISITLDHVSIKEALDTITAAAGCRYAKVGNTYFVAPSDKFAGLMQQLKGADTDQEIRVIPTYSGRGGQISLSVEKAIPNNGALTYFIALPSENITAKSEGQKSGGSGGAEGGQGGGAPQGGGAAGGAGGGGGAPQGGGAQGGGGGGGSAKGAQAQQVKATDSPGQDPYMILVGPRETLDSVEALARKMDRDLCRQMGVDYPETWEMATSTYHCQANSAEALLASICETDRAAELKTQPLRTVYGRVEIYATPSNVNVDQKLYMRGPKQEVDRLIALLQGLDDTGGDSAKVSVYNVHYSDPRALREDLLVQVPGLRVTIPAASVSSPQAYQPNQTLGQAQQEGVAATGSQTTGPSASGGSSGSSSGSSSSGSSGSGGSSGNANLPGQGGDKSDQDGLGLPFASMEANTVPMRLVLKGTSSQIEQAERYLKAVDTAPKQVAIELRVMELSKDDAINAGINWNLFTGGAVKFLNLNNSQGTATNNSATVNVNNFGINGDVVGQLDKIATKNNLVARPNLLATDGRQSEVFIGDAIRYVESIISSQNGPSVTTGTVRVGVRLALLPRVGAGGNITMELRPLVSFLKGFTQVPQIGGQLPQTSERVAQSTLTMKSGETIAIGGLIQDQDTKNAQGLPFLMDLPILGNLFKRTTNDKTRTELVIFVTAREVDGAATGANYALPMQDPEPQKPAKGK